MVYGGTSGFCSDESDMEVIEVVLGGDRSSAWW